jgi:hypothetical protein
MSRSWRGATHHNLISTLRIPLRIVNSGLQEYFDKPPDLVSVDAGGIASR